MGIVPQGKQTPLLMIDFGIGQEQVFDYKLNTNVLLQLQVRFPEVWLIVPLLLVTLLQGTQTPLLMIDSATGQTQRLRVKLKTKVALH